MTRSRLILERTGWSVRSNSSGFADLTTPSARNKVASRLLIDRASTPPLRGGECSLIHRGILAFHVVQQIPPTTVPNPAGQADCIDAGPGGKLIDRGAG